MRTDMRMETDAPMLTERNELMNNEVKDIGRFNPTNEGIASPNNIIIDDFAEPHQNADADDANDRFEDD